MKIKNIAVGSYIQSKKDSKQLIAGHCYQVAEKDVSDKTVRLFSVDDSFDDSLWFCVSDFRKPRPLLKQLDQSIFDGLDEKWRFAAVNVSGALILSTHPIEAMSGSWVRNRNLGKLINYGLGYDASNWQNSLIERSTAKELTGSDLCRAMLARGDKYVMCKTSGTGEAEAMEAEYPDVIQKYDWEFFYTPYKKRYAVPINNQGEPLTASEVGL